MFIRKKNKKRKNIYTSSYVVKDVDNIISIAQSYGVPWKELAKVNNIDPPYILISGETISVPGNNKDIDIENGKKVSNVDTSEYERTHMSAKDVQVQQANKKSINNTKSNTKVTQRLMKSKLLQKSDQRKNINSAVEKKAQKITYASPKNMLHKPSAEPAMQAIDIAWMRDDEEVYSEEMQSQRKKINILFSVVSVFIIVIISGVAWWGITSLLNYKKNQNISVQTLIKDDIDIKEGKSEDVVADKKDNINKNQEVNENIVTEGGQDISEIENIDDKHKNNEQDNKKLSAQEITIQVLNAGAQVGSAGTVTKIFAKKGYKTITAQNAKHNYKGVVIYYDENKEYNLDDVAQNIPKKYGIQKYENSDEVTKKYKADFVIVLGS